MSPGPGLQSLQGLCVPRDDPSLAVSRAGLAGAGSHWLWWEVPLPMAGRLDGVSFKVPPRPSQAKPFRDCMSLFRGCPLPSRPLPQPPHGGEGWAGLGWAGPPLLGQSALSPQVCSARALLSCHHNRHCCRCASGRGTTGVCPLAGSVRFARAPARPALSGPAGGFYGEAGCPPPSWERASGLVSAGGAVFSERRAGRGGVGERRKGQASTNGERQR